MIFFISYRVYLRKPEDEIYQQVIYRYNVSPLEIFFIGDMEENVKAAKRKEINA
jgi:HAD superfamily hydrolase (TIGR01509 family)